MARNWMATRVSLMPYRSRGVSPIVPGFCGRWP